MKTLFTGVKLDHMRNELHVGFHVDAKALVTKSGAGALGVTAQFTGDYVPKLTIEQKLLDMITKSRYTRKIVNKDRERDATGSGFVAAAKALTRYPLPEKSEPAAELYSILEHYGDFGRKGYTEQTSATTDILDELALPANKALVEATGLGFWVEELKRLNDEFLELVHDRDEEISQRPEQQMKVARADVDASWHAILARVEAMIILNGIDYTTALAPFVHEYNTIAERYKRTLAQERGRRAAAKEEEEGEEEL
jgi:hypothetical protein